MSSYVHLKLSAAICMVLVLMSTNSYSQNISLMDEHRSVDHKASVNQTKSRALITWDGSHSSDWNDFRNWNTGSVPGSTDDVYIPSGTPNDPYIDQSSNNYCHDIEIAAGVIFHIDSDLTLGGSLNIYGSVLNNGNIYHTSNVMINLYGGTSETFGGTGDFSYLDEWVSFIIRSDNSAHYTLSNDIDLLQQFEMESGTYLSLNTFTLQTYSFTLDPGATFNLNTGIWKHSGGTASINGIFNCNTGTCWFNSGSTVYSPVDQTVPVETYYNLRLNCNAGTTCTLGALAAAPIIVGNDLKISAPSSSGGIADCVSTIECSGNFILGDTGDNGITLKLSSGKILSNGSGTFTQNSNSSNQILISMENEDAISGFANENAYAFSGLVSYTGNNSQHVIPADYEDLSLSGSGQKHISENLNIDGNFTVASGSVELNGTKVGSSDATFENYGPFYNYYENNRTQILYLNNEIGESGTINNIAFKLTEASEEGYRYLNNLVIKIKHTSLSSLPAYFTDMSGATTVLSTASYDMPSSAGWFSIDITDFTFNGTDNLLIEITWGDNGSYTFNEYNLSRTDFTSGTDYYVCYGYADTETPPNYDGRSKYRPVIKFSGIGKSNNLNIAGNIENAGSISYGSAEITMDGTTQQSINGGNSAIHKLELNNNAGAILSGNTSISDSLKLTQGKFDLASSTLSLGTTSEDISITGGNNTSYIITSGSGTIKMHHNNSNTDYHYPVGCNSYYTPFTFNPGNSTLATDAHTNMNISTSTHPHLADTSNAHLCRYWSLSPTGITDPDYDVSFTYHSDNIIGTESLLFPAKYSNEEWSSGESAADTVNNTLSWTGLTSFSDFTGVAKALLPIEIMEFSAECYNGSVELNWITASEKNGEAFIIERSNDKLNFTPVHQQYATGNSNQIQYYSWIDTKLNQGDTYYRLKLLDTDGSYKYSPLVHTSCNPTDSGTFIQKSGNAYLLFLNPMGKDTDISLYTKQGVLLEYQRISSTRQECIPFDLSNYKSGIYLLNIINADQNLSFSLTKF